MRRGGRRGIDEFFSDPFASFGDFGRPGSFSSNFFGGRDPFDDPFFNQPFGSMFGPSMLGPGIFGPSMFGQSTFGSGIGPFGHAETAGFLENQEQQPKSRGPIITEINSDEEEERAEEDGASKGKKENSRKHSRPGKEPYVQDPDEQVEEKKSKHVQQPKNYKNIGAALPQARSYSFHSSSVTYGGPNGAYYTSSKSRRAGGDGVTMEEMKEADTTTGKATHKVFRGLHDKGHSITRDLNTDGRVDTMQALHNLNEDELTGFGEAWKRNAKKHLPGWNQGLDMLDDHSMRAGPSGQNRNWALPSTVQRPQERSGYPTRRTWE